MGTLRAIVRVYWHESVGSRETREFVRRCCPRRMKKEFRSRVPAGVHFRLSNTHPRRSRRAVDGADCYSGNLNPVQSPRGMSVVLER